jgi:hypothetical protein
MPEALVELSSLFPVQCEEARMRLETICIALAILFGPTASAWAGRYELVPEPDVRQVPSNQALFNRVASAYVIDKKANQFWICTAR